MTALRIRFSLLSAALAIFSVDLQADEPSPGDRPIHEYPISESDRDHWSFQPIRPQALPEIEHRDWPINGIDYFTVAKMESKSLAPSEEADRGTLLRRLKFDLVGLPPTPEELEAFEADRSPDAYEQWVERFLSSPRFGERWGQWWLDLARFAETDGFEHDRVRQDAWQYRDWVIDAFNHDLPYDQFVFQQLAGGETPEAADSIATMFGLAGPDMPDLNDQALRRHDRLNDLTSTVGATLLGLQFHCAQCHDHKHDPISQADFYRLRAIFEGSIPELVRDKPLNRLTSVSTIATARFFFRGELQQAGPVIQAGFPRIAVSSANETHLAQSATPRTEFATWLFSESNPLTARVIVNRLWQRHFGRGLAASPSDFGVVPSDPSHPALLDWLAVELRRKAWSMKSLHRLIVTSATYRQRSRDAVDSTGRWKRQLELDPENRWLSRFPRRRLEAEEVRDSMLAASEGLNFESGGVGVMPPLPDELIRTLLKGQWKASDDEADHARRSVYVFARRNLRYPILEAFDRPDALASCPERNRSTTAIQALQMFNSDFSLESARRLRDRILSIKDANLSQRIDMLFRVTLNRFPTGDERELFKAFVARSAKSENDGLLEACLAILNSNEFVYVD